ncbi:MAG: DUF6569 family protein [Bacteroidia bacterium]|nr:DUF6569 family protein [Bacteroidia bacterium]
MRLLCTLLVGVGLWCPLFGQFTYEHLTVDYESAIAFRNLQLVPIREKTAGVMIPVNQGSGTSEQFTSLRDAMARNLLRIVDQAGVNQLLIDNLSDEPVLLLSGEILKGGKQDRMIGRDMVLPPNSRRNRVPVFCVEEKRWSSPKTWSYYHEGSMHLRRVVDQAQDQQQVWKEVAYELNRDRVASGTQAYTSHGNNPAFAALEQEYVRVFALEAFSDPGSIAGMLAVSGSVVLGCDVFASPALFLSEYEGLVFSYIDEAITYGLPVDMTTEAIRQYSDKLFSNERMQKAFIQQYGKAFTYEGRIIHITTFNDRETLRDYDAIRN